LRLQNRQTDTDGIPINAGIDAITRNFFKLIDARFFASGRKSYNMRLNGWLDARTIFLIQPNLLSDK
jgi:hypothetical protein